MRRPIARATSQPTLHRFASSSYAIASKSLDVGTGAPDWIFGSGRYAKVRISATNAAPGKTIFIGIGRDRDVADYLAGAAHDEVTDFEVDPFSVDYRHHAGAAPVTPPAKQRFWVASTQGTGTQTLTWGVRKGTWSVVAMNADASRPVAVEASFAAKLSFLGWIAVGLLTGGGIFLLGGSGLIYLGARRPAPLAAAMAAGPAPPAAVAGGEAGVISGYPVVVEGRLDEPLSRWLWLVKWLLASALRRARDPLGRLPRPQCDRLLRHPLHRPLPARHLRVQSRRPTLELARALLLLRGARHRPLPTLQLDPVPDYPATLDVAYPERLSRGLVLVKWWLLAIPHYLVVTIFAGGWLLRPGFWWSGTGTRTGTAAA